MCYLSTLEQKKEEFFVVVAFQQHRHSVIAIIIEIYHLVKQ